MPITVLCANFCNSFILVYEGVKFSVQELDFLVEARNSERCLLNFRKLSPHIADYVYAPKVHWNLSTTKLLTMEFMDGAYITDVKNIRKLGIQPRDISRLVSSYSFLTSELHLFFPPCIFIGTMNNWCGSFGAGQSSFC